MAFFLIISPDRAGGLDDRLRLRDRHVAYWTGQPGTVKVGGAMLRDGGPVGSVLLVEADSEDAARALLAADPFAFENVFTGDTQIVELRPAIGDWLPGA